MSELEDERGPAVDLSMIESLLEIGGVELLTDLVDLFCVDAPTQIAELDSAAREGDAARLEAVAHSLKSSCANLGALRLSELSKEIEAAGRSGAIERVAAVIELTKAEFEQVNDELRAHLA